MRHTIQQNQEKRKIRDREARRDGTRQDKTRRKKKIRWTKLTNHLDPIPSLPLNWSNRKPPMKTRIHQATEYYLLY